MANTSEALSIALQHHQAGRLSAAEEIYRQILSVEPNNADAHHLLGLVAIKNGRLDLAVESIRRAISLNGNAAAFHFNLGIALTSQGKLDEAIASFDRVLQLNPSHANAREQLGDVLKTKGKLEEAAESYQRTLELRPDNADVHNKFGMVLQEQRKYDEAVAQYSRALKFNPNFAEAHNNMGTALELLGKFDEAIASYHEALRLDPDYVYAHSNMGNSLASLRKLDEAIASHRRAIELKPDLAQAHLNLGNTLKERGMFPDAISSYRRALELAPDIAEGFFNLGIALQESRKPDEAIVAYRNALKLNPGHPATLVNLVHQMQSMCDWEGLEVLVQEVIDGVCQNTARSKVQVSPFAFLSLPAPTTSEQQLRSSMAWVRCRVKTEVGNSFKPAPKIASNDKSKITIGYLSADFYSHATAWLIAELLEKHNRHRFKIYGYSFGPDDGSTTRRRIVGAFDRFVEVKNLSDRQAAEQIAADGVDILVDLKGYTKDARTQILAYRPAPIQVNYLGYPGTMGATFMDYILVDDYIVPADQQPFYSEKQVHLPGCYQVNDSQREISSRTPSRAECNLPENGFVYCCFNNSYKITPEMFGVWMELLNEVPGSVLWLLEGNRFVAKNLRHEAQVRDVSPARLVFAPRASLPEHLARHRLADLFLDTLPVNAHTTASDALWAGCPLLTISGETFVSRVAGSLLRALDLPELITTSLDQYKAMALKLARDKMLLESIRTRLLANRQSSSLFDGGRSTRNLESAFETMWDIHSTGEKPRAFRVEPNARVNAVSLPSREAVANNLCELAINGDDAQAHSKLGMAYQRQGKLEQAVASYRRALELNPNSTSTHNNLGIVLKELGRQDEAMTCYGRALALNPGYALAHNNIGTVLQEQGKFDEAEASYRHALGLQPDFVLAYYNIANVLQAQGKFDEAIANYRRAVELKPDFADAHTRLGTILRAQGKAESAVVSYRRALELEPHSLDANYGLAMVLHRLGELDEAVECCRRVLELQPDFANAHNQLGITLQSQGKLDEAADSFHRALVLQPDSAGAHYNLAAVLQDLGKLSEAIARYKLSLEIDPNHANAHFKLGTALQGQGRLDEAIASYRRALELNSNFAEVHCNLGVTLLRQGKLNEAEASYRLALELNPDSPETHYNLGNTLKNQGKLDEAAASYRRAIELNPQFAEAHSNLGFLLQDQGKSDEAVECYRHAIALKPEFAAAHNNFGTLLQSLGMLDEAMASYRRAIELKPDFADAHGNLGKSLKLQGKLEAAIASFRRALDVMSSIESGCTGKTACETYRQLAETLNMLGDIENSQSAIEEALRIDPNDVESRIMRGFLHLQSGRFELGWPDYEARKKGRFASRVMPGPEWDGSHHPDKTILLFAEQGLGDSIQFIRYASLVRKSFGRVVLLVYKPLLKLMRLCPYLDEVVAEGDALPPYDYQISLLSLPSVFQTSMATVPREIPYLFAAQSLVDRWRDRLSNLSGFRIAIAWQGNREFGNDMFRRVPLREFGRLASIPGVQLISLQKGEGTQQLQDIDFNVRSFDDMDTNEGSFMDSAAIMKNVDLVITPCTAIPHLAGGLGVSVWLAKSFVSDWRWMAGDRPDNPWYPTMRMFRQPKLEDWETVFERMATEITGLISGRESKGRVG